MGLLGRTDYKGKPTTRFGYGTHPSVQKIGKEDVFRAGKKRFIGTKIATQILKDGMEVGVDADKGVVRILKRAYFFIGFCRARGARKDSIIH